MLRKAKLLCFMWFFILGVRINFIFQLKSLSKFISIVTKNNNVSYKMWFIMESCIYTEICLTTGISRNMEYFYAETNSTVKQTFAPCTWNQCLSSKSISVSLYLQIIWRQKAFLTMNCLTFLKIIYISHFITR